MDNVNHRNKSIMIVYLGKTYAPKDFLRLRKIADKIVPLQLSLWKKGNERRNLPPTCIITGKDIEDLQTQIKTYILERKDAEPFLEKEKTDNDIEICIDSFLSTLYMYKTRPRRFPEFVCIFEIYICEM